MFQDKLRVLKKYLKKNLTKNFIQISSFFAIFSIFFVRKSDEELWFCVNYKNLNVMIIKNQYSLSLIRETLNWLIKVRYYIKLDIIVIFNKLRMTHEKEWKIAFQTRYELYKYNVLLFELINDSSSYQNFINNTLHDFLNVFCMIYMNNILIYNNITKKHTQHVRQVLERLRVVNLQIDIEKCKFTVIEIKYLSLIIIINEIKMNFEKINAVIDWTVFRNVKNVQNFLNFVNFYQWFIQEFFKLTSLLTTLIKKNLLFSWFSKCQTVFDQLKHAFIIISILMHFNLEFFVTVKINAFDYIVTKIMSQRDFNQQL